MASSKKSLSDFLNKEEFNFDIKDGLIIFGPIYNKQKDRIRMWECKIYLYDSKTQINITKDLIDINNFRKLNKKLTTHIISEQGLVNGKLTISTPTIITVGKNLDKKNETTVLTQALINARSLFLKKLNSGYTLNIEMNNEKDKVFPFPMAVNVYEKYKSKLKYPLFIQPKLDGIRLISKEDNNKIILKSRRMKDISDFEMIKNELQILISKHKNFFIDGELYNHGMNLQEISGIVRNVENGNDIDKERIKYYIFDCFDIDKPNLNFEERQNILKEMFDDNKFKYLVYLDTYKLEDEKEGDKLYKQFLKNKYEGAIYKNNMPYEFSYEKEKRSNLYLKRKEHFDEEYKIINFTSGKGSYKDCIVFILETDEHKEFNSVPMWTIEQKREAFKKANDNFIKYFKNKLATVRYDALSSNNIPLRSRVVAIRDYE